MIIERSHDDHSLGEIHGSVNTNKRKGWRRIFSFLGPAYLISVGYMDPGNWATDLQGGSKFGYSLIWVLLMSNLMALLLQGLSARLGIVRGRDLAQANREAYPKFLNFILYILAEIAIAACDLAEVLGMAIGIQLLTGLPLIWGVSITVLDTFLLLYLQKLGMRKMEAFIIALVGVIAVSFLIQIIMAKPDVAEIATGLIPSIPNNEALYIAIGIIGATVMPHNLYLHSALVQSRNIERTDAGIRQAIKFNRIDSAIALNIAFLVNAAILIVAASVFFKTGNTQVGELHEAYKLLPSFLGNLAPILFAVALIAAGQSSTVTGTLAGQIVMEGYLRLRINPLIRRLITRLIAIIPAVIVILIYGDDEVDSLLIFSQVILSLQLGFAIIPLIHFVSDKSKMGKFAINNITKVGAWVIALVLIYLNFKMLATEVEPVFEGNNLWSQTVIVLSGIFFTGLLLYIVIEPSISRRRSSASIKIHPEMERLTLDIPQYHKIAIALDFSENDQKLISYALGQGNIKTEYVLVHIVESASANIWASKSDDYETRKDQKQLTAYVDQLTEKGFKTSGALGFKSRAKEIVRLVKECDADMLVVGTHGHKGVKDLIYGQTVDSVRHSLKIPVLMVNIKNK
ncbi:MAG TPA: Nramp family divalent metal transporter [Hanamia sp.]|jgi:manganese transport protein|nr:Nramp family divalent metal transporter [Hanamia sp.]